MKLGIVVPWRFRPSRGDAFTVTVNRLMDQFPDSAIYYADTGDEVFNVSGSRNKGCLSAIKDGCDMLLVVDADTLLEKDSLDAAIIKAIESGLVCMPFYVYARVSEIASTSVINGEMSFEDAAIGSYSESTEHPGGAYVMSSSTFLRLNGWDERFVGWGYEDDAFAEAHRALLGKKLGRVDGIALALYHEDRDQEYVEENRQRFYSYVNKPKALVSKIVEGNMTRKPNE
jgi:predicted glycosyltransferase involved in capsule biosynthesis